MMTDNFNADTLLNNFLAAKVAHKNAREDRHYFEIDCGGVLLSDACREEMRILVSAETAAGRKLDSARSAVSRAVATYGVGCHPNVARLWRGLVDAGVSGEFRTRMR